MAGHYLSAADPAIESNSTAIRLNPAQPWKRYYEMGTAFALFAAERFEDALAAADLPLAIEPNFAPALRLKAAAHGVIGDRKRAGEHANRLLEVWPEATVQTFARFYAAPLSRNPQCLETFLKGLRIAGLPEA